MDLTLTQWWVLVAVSALLGLVATVVSYCLQSRREPRRYRWGQALLMSLGMAVPFFNLIWGLVLAAWWIKLALERERRQRYRPRR